MNKYFQKNSYCRPILVNFLFFREALKDLLLTETIPAIPSKCKIVKILIFFSVSPEHLPWKCSQEREGNISILPILHLFYSPVWRVLKLLFAIRLLPDMLILNTSHIFFEHFQHSGWTPATLRNKFLWLPLND